MLPATARLTRSEDFSAVVGRGRRAGRRTLVVHVLCREAGGDDVSVAASPPRVRVGFVVSRAVGDAVTRNRVKRRLRHLVRARLDGIPRGALVAVRALPPSAAATSGQLAHDLDAALGRALRRTSPSAPAGVPARGARETR